MRTISLLLFVLLLNSTVQSQITIGSKEKPLSGAILDLKEGPNKSPQDMSNSEKGLALPRVELSKIDQLFPMFGTKDAVAEEYTNNKEELDNAHVGLLVYNLTDDPDEPLCKGLYAWDGNEWIRIPEPCEPAVPPVNPDLIMTPNSFIVKASSISENIPIAKPFLVWEKETTLGQVALSGKVTVDLIWQDTPDLIESVSLIDGDKGPHSEMQVKTKNKTGNALVGVWVGPNGSRVTDQLCWSWHIWVTDYDPSTGTTYPHNNGSKDYVFMDRNLGATSANPNDVNTMGLFYQWGRKDPFTSLDKFTFGLGGLDPKPLYDIDNVELTEVNELAPSAPIGTGIQHKEVVENVNLRNSIINPTVFYYGAIRPIGDNANNYIEAADWYTSGTSGDLNLWGASGDKSIYDPCPAGWRVPANSPNGKTPWARFESDPEIIGGSGGDFVSTGVNLNASSQFTGLGFYPHGPFRIPRAFYEGCGMTGSEGPDTFVGGLFAACNIDDINIHTYYWTASPVEGELKAKGLYINANGWWPSINAQERPRSTGAYVRCVQE